MSRKLSDLLDFMLPDQAIYVHMQHFMSDAMTPVFSGSVGQLRFNSDYRAILAGKVFALAAENNHIRIFVYPNY